MEIVVVNTAVFFVRLRFNFYALAIFERDVPKAVYRVTAYVVCHSVHRSDERALLIHFPLPYVFEVHG